MGKAEKLIIFVLLLITVTDIKYLQDNFDMDAKVTFDHMMKPEYLEDYPVDEIDYLDKLGTFQNYKGDLYIQN